MLKLASRIVTAYLRANRLPVAEIPALISSVAQALEQTATPAQAVAELSPAVPIKKSVSAEAIICLECGARQKTLKRHLQSAHGLTAEEYRERWGLGADYPIVAPDYAERRSQLAKDAGLGRKPAKAEGTGERAGGAKPAFKYPASRWSRTSK